MKQTKLLSFFAGVALALFLGSCASDDIAQKSNGTGDIPTDEATFEAAPVAPTRTTMSNTGVFKWQSGDKIWVKDDTGAWRQSSNAPTSETASFKFKVPGTFTASNTYTVYYPGNGGNQDQVTISASQSQTDPDAPAHVGVSGDCGWATATKITPAPTSGFKFTLDHKAAFLVFSPYCNNNSIINSNDVKLTKIEVTSDNDLVGTYTLDPATNQLTGTGSGKQINLTTTGGSATPNGFSVPTSATPATNASYVVIKPGTHTLKVRFWLKDYTTNIEGTVTKLYPSFSYAANTYYNMSSELKVNYTTPYYMWDAQQPYWYGHEWDKTGYTAGTDQPTVNYQTGSAYPQSNTDPRWYNETFPGSGIQNDATQSHFTSLPNVNEMSWYAMKGDPRWDGDELWTAMGHLYKGGMWFKKKAKISGFRSDKAADNSTDLRTASSTFSNTPTNISSNPLSASDQSNYFYLPALGYYDSAPLYGVGNFGRYWSSSAYPNSPGYACSLYFNSGVVYVGSNPRNLGFSVRAFE